MQKFLKIKHAYTITLLLSCVFLITACKKHVILQAETELKLRSVVLKDTTTNWAHIKNPANQMDLVGVYHNLYLTHLMESPAFASFFQNEFKSKFVLTENQTIPYEIIYDEVIEQTELTFGNAIRNELVSIIPLESADSISAIRVMDICSNI